MERLCVAYDVVVLPTTPTTAFPLGAHTQNPVEMYLADTYTVPASIAGVPAVSIPNGKDGNGLPIGLQLVTGSFTEDRLLAYAEYIGAL